MKQQKWYRYFSLIVVSASVLVACSKPSQDNGAGENKAMVKTEQMMGNQMSGETAADKQSDMTTDDRMMSSETEKMRDASQSKEDMMQDNLVNPKEAHMSESEMERMASDEKMSQ